MKVHFYLVGVVDPPILEHIEMANIPRVGDTVDIPGQSQGDTVVRTVVWYPYDDTEADVYIVLGRARMF